MGLSRNPLIRLLVDYTKLRISNLSLGSLRPNSKASQPPRNIVEATTAPSFPMEEFVVLLAIVYIITDVVVEAATKPTEVSVKGILSGMAFSMVTISTSMFIADFLIGTRGWMIGMFAGAIFNTRVIRGRKPESSKKEEAERNMDYPPRTL